MFDVNLGMVGPKIGIGEECAVLETFRRRVGSNEPNIINSLRGEIRVHGLRKTEYVAVLMEFAVRIGNIVELLSHGPKAVLSPHIGNLSRRFSARSKRKI